MPRPAAKAVNPHWVELMHAQKLVHPSAVASLNAHDLARLRTLLPIRHLNDTEFAAIAAHVDVEACAPGRELFRSGRDDAWIFYLLDGALTLTAANGASFTVTAGSIEAQHSLSPQATACTLARAKTPARVVRLPASYWLTPPTGLARIGVDVAELTDMEFDRPLLFAIYHAVRDGRLVLPSLPRSEARSHALANDEGKGSNDPVSILSTDPALAADLAQGLRGMFTSSNPHCADLLRLAWRHATEISALSVVIARRVTGQNPEQAMLAGLVHELGVMVMLAELPNHPALVADRDTLKVAVRELKHQVTAMILRAWKFPERFVEATFAAEHWTRPHASSPDLCDTLLLAHWHAPTADLPWADPRPSQCPVLTGLAPEVLDECGRLRCVTEARDELAKMRALLGGV